MIPSSSITMGKSTTIPSNRDIRGPIPYQRRTFRPKTSKWLIKVSISSFQRTLIRRISPRWRILPWGRREGDFTGRFAPRPAGRRAERGAPLSDETKAAPETAQSWLSIPPLDVKFPADGSSWHLESSLFFNQMISYLYELGDQLLELSRPKKTHLLTQI